MTLTRTAAAAAIALPAVALAACTATPTQTPVPAEPQAAAAMPSDEQMCSEYADALTLFSNMRLANGDGRLIGNEWDGIQRLAIRMVDGIAVDESSSVGAALAAMQRQMPDLSATWTQGTLSDPVQAACSAAIPDWGIEGWVGG